MEALKLEISKLVARDQNANELPLFFPAGQGHFVQPLIPNLSPELEEFDLFNRNHLFLLDASESLGFEFTLNDSGDFASFKNDQVMALLDLRESSLHLLYVFANAKKATALIRELNASGCYYSKRLFSKLLLQAESSFEKVVEFDYHFEELAFRKLNPLCLKGSVKGDAAPVLFKQLTSQLANQVNLTSVAGSMAGSELAVVKFQASGLMVGNDVRLDDFCKAIFPIWELLLSESKVIEEEYIWRLEEIGQGLTPEGQAKEIKFAKNLEQPEQLLKLLTTGVKPLELWGSSRLIARNHWKLFVSDAKGLLLEMELTTGGMKFYLKSLATQFVMEKILAFVAISISPWSENDSAS